MFEIDKIRFGKFVAEQRKKKGYTQKDLAQKLMISDKAVSKWETGNSLPDVSLLLPLAEALDVNITELLEGQRLPQETSLSREQVETLVKKTLTFSDDTPEKIKKRRRKKLLIYSVSAAFSGIIIFLIHLSGISFTQFPPDFYTLEILSVLFGGYFWIFISETLPPYYDQYKINYYYGKFFRINLPGIRFNNSNWPYILLAGRIWSVGWMIFLPFICLLGTAFFKDFWLHSLILHKFLLFLFLGTLFIPMMIAGKKYE